MGEVVFTTQPYPFARKELETAGGEQFLEGPTPREPSAPSNVAGQNLLRLVKADGYIGEVYVANHGVLVPTEHGVDGLGKFSTAPFVDATA